MTTGCEGNGLVHLNKGMLVVVEFFISLYPAQW